VAQKRFRRNY